MQLRTHLTDGLLLILFELLARTGHLNPVFYLLVDTGGNLGLGHLDTVDGGLVEEEFLHGNLLGNGTVGIALETNAFLGGLQTHLLDVATQDGFVADNPDDFVDNALRTRRANE